MGFAIRLAHQTIAYMKLLSQGEEYIFELDVSNFLIKFSWKDKYLSSYRFKQILLTFVGQVELHKPKFLFVDARKNKVTMTAEIQEWHDSIIVPRYLKAKVQAIAFIRSPESIFSRKLTHKKTFEKDIAKKGLRTSFFKTEEEAYFWFMQLSAAVTRVSA